MVNRGVRGYKTDLLRKHLDAHVFGTAVDQIFLLIGTNDIGKEISQKETLDNVEAVLQAIMRDFPLTHINLISVLPVSQEERYKQKVYVRTNEKNSGPSTRPIKNWPKPTTRSAMSMYLSLLDEVGQLAEAYTTDGLHLSVAGYPHSSPSSAGDVIEKKRERKKAQPDKSSKEDLFFFKLLLTNVNLRVK